MAVRLERIILEVEDRASRPMATFAQATRGASSALHDLDGSSSDSAQAVSSAGKAAGTAAPKVSNLAAATAKAEAAQRKQADAAGALRVAEAKLAEVREKGTANAGAVAAAEERVAKARRDLSAETSKAVVASAAVVKANDDVSTSARRADQSINQLTGRLAVWRDVAVTLGPGLVPIGALAVPAVTGLASALGFTAIAAGTVVAGFQDVGTALEAVNKAQLEPTAKNLAAARQAMQELSPAARDMVREIDSLGPALESLRDASAAGLAPGVGRSVANLQELLPRLRGLFEETARAAGDFAGDATESLNSERWAPFLAFLEREAPSAITSLGQSAGDLTHGLAELWMAMDPLNDDLLRVISRAAEGFDDWAMNLGQTEGFREFVEYVRQSGPQVAEAFQSLGNAVLQIAEAAAPLGGPVLAAVSAIADGVAAIADSPIGTPFLAAVAAVTTLNRLLKVTAALSAVSGATSVANAAAAGGVGAAASKAATATRAAGPVGLAVGAALVAGPPLADLINQAKGYDGITSSIESLSGQLRKGQLPNEFEAIRQATDFLSERNGFQQFMDSGSRLFGTEIGKLKESDDMIQALDQSLTGIAQQRGPEAASRAFDKLTTQAGMSREEIGELKNLLPGLTDAIGSRSVGDLLNIFDDLPGILNRGTRAANTFKGALQSATAALEGRASARDFEASIDDATAALRQNGRTLDINTAKGRANSAALDNIAGSALKVADGMRGANRVEFLKGARGDFIAMARDMGKTAAQARNLADRLGLIGRQDVRPKIDINKAPFDAVSRAIMAGLRNLDRQNPRPTADINDGPFKGRRAVIMAQLGVTDRFTANPLISVNDQASGRIAGINNQLDNIPRSISTTVTTYFRQIGRAFQQKADGGLVSGPGGPRDDVIPTMLSNGEYVINAASAARNMALLEQINSGGRQSAAMAAARSAPQPQSMAVSFDDVRLTGTVDTRTGLATMTGIARAAARSELDTWERDTEREAR